MTIFGTLTVAKQGLTAQGRAIQVTSNNIANVNTPGYTRQRPVFEPITPSSLPGGFPLGGGAELNRIQRVVDAALDAQLRRERQGLASDTEIESGLARIEGIFEALGGSGLSAALSEFFASLNDLANRPHESTVRETVVQSASTLADMIRDTDRRLSQLQLDTNQKIDQKVTEINPIALNIAELNREITAKEVGGNAVASSLRDRRGQLLEELGEKIDFTSFERDDGEIAVFVGGGFLLVDGEFAGRLRSQQLHLPVLPEETRRHDHSA